MTNESTANSTPSDVKGAGTREDPWVLKTPPGTSEFLMFRDETLDPPTLVCQVDKTELRYYLRCLTDLHAMLQAHGDWMLLGTPMSRNRPQKEPSKLGRDRLRTLSAAGMA